MAINWIAHRLIAALVFLQFAAVPLQAQQLINRPPHGLQIVVWAGQSNAVGRAALSEGVVGKQHEFMLTLGGKWAYPAFAPTHTTEEQWGGSLAPFIWPVGDRGGYGADLAFLDEWVRLNSKTNVALVNVAVGGTYIAQHLPPGAIYQAVRNQIARAQVYGSIAAIVWIQGETDASHGNRARNYASHFTQLVSAWRTEYGAVPIVVAQLGDPIEPDRWPYWSIVKKQQLMGCAAIERCILVATGGLRRYLVNGIEGPHYTRESYDTLGQAIARALYSLTH